MIRDGSTSRDGLDALRPSLRERIARYLTRSPTDAAEAQRLLVETYYEGLTDGVLRERVGILRYVEAMVLTRAVAFGALKPGERAVATAQHAGASEVLFTVLERLMGRPRPEPTDV